MDQEREASEHVIVLDAGNAMTGGGNLGDATRGEVIVAGMNLIGYDAMGLGGKDLTVGVEALADRLEQAEFPIVSANVTRSGEDAPVADPFTVVERGGHRIGVVGITGVPDQIPPGFDVLDPELVLSAVIPDVRDAAGTVVLVTDLPLEEAQSLAQGTPGIDLIVAGDPASMPREATEVPSTNTLVVVAENPSPRHTGRNVGRLVVSVGTDGQLHDVQWTTRILDETYEDDPAMDELLSEYEVPR